MHTRTPSSHSPLRHDRRVVLEARPRSTRAFRLSVGTSIGLAAAAFLGACQSYKAQPLNETAIRSSFDARDAADSTVSSFIERQRSEHPSTSVSFDVADGLSLSEAELVALVYNADLRVARMRVGVAKATADNAGIWEDPTLAVDLTRILASVEHQWKVAAPIGITIPISGRLEAETARAGAELAAEVARVNQSEWATRMDLRRAWADWLAAASRLEITRDFTGRLDKVVAAANRMEEAGEMPRVEARLFRIEHASRQAEIRHLESTVAEHALRIKHMMGLAPSSAVSLSAYDAPLGVNAIPTDQSIESSSPAMQVARAEYEVAERALAKEIRGQYPDIQVGPGYGNEEGNDEFLIGVQMPLPLWNRNRQGVAVANAERDLARVQFESVYERLLSELESARTLLKSADEQRELVETQIVPMADQQYADSMRILELGEMNTLVLLETLQGQQAVKEQVIEIRHRLQLASIRVQELTGPSTSNIPTPTPNSTPAQTQGGAQ